MLSNIVWSVISSRQAGFKDSGVFERWRKIICPYLSEAEIHVFWRLFIEYSASVIYRGQYIRPIDP